MVTVGDFAPRSMSEIIEAEMPLPAARVLQAAVRVETRRPAYSGGVPV